MRDLNRQLVDLDQSVIALTRLQECLFMMQATFQAAEERRFELGLIKLFKAFISDKSGSVLPPSGIEEIMQRLAGKRLMAPPEKELQEIFNALQCDRMLILLWELCDQVQGVSFLSENYFKVFWSTVELKFSSQGSDYREKCIALLMDKIEHNRMKELLLIPVAKKFLPLSVIENIDRYRFHPLAFEIIKMHCDIVCNTFKKLKEVQLASFTRIISDLSSESPRKGYRIYRVLQPHLRLLIQLNDEIQSIDDFVSVLPALHTDEQRALYEHHKKLVDNWARPRLDLKAHYWVLLREGFGYQENGSATINALACVAAFLWGLTIHLSPRLVAHGQIRGIAWLGRGMEKWTGLGFFSRSVAAEAVRQDRDYHSVKNMYRKMNRPEKQQEEFEGRGFAAPQLQ